MKRNTLSIFIVLLVLVVSGARCQIISLGACPVLTPLTPIRPVLLTRVWFEQRRTPSINEHGLKCVSASVTFATAFSIRYTANAKVTNTRVNLNGNAVFVAGVNVGSLQLTFSNGRLPFVRAKPISLTVINMDGTVAANNVNTVVTVPTWLTLYSCKDLPLGLKMETAYILTTLRVPAPATIAAALDSLTVRNLPTENLKVVEQTNC